MATANSIDVTQYSDIPFSGVYFNSGASSLRLTGIDAIKNVIKFYLLSAQGDYGREVGKGGVLFQMIGKPLTETNRQQISTLVTNGLAQFTNIVINSINTSIDLAGKQFVINIIFSDTYNKFTSSISLGVPAS